MGTYNLTGGLLDGGPGSTAQGGLEIVGVSGTGTFNQSGGTNIASLGLYVGGSWSGSISSLPTIGGSGVYTLSGGLLQIPIGHGNVEYIGQAGTGIFTQTGGTNLTANIQLSGVAQGTKPGNNGQYATPGTYNLQGGLLQTNSIGVAPLFYDGGATNFNFSGGTLQAATAALTGLSGLSVALPLNITGSSPAELDMNGQQVFLRASYTSSLTDLNLQDARRRLADAERDNRQSGHRDQPRNDPGGYAGNLLRPDRRRHQRCERLGEFQPCRARAGSRWLLIRPTGTSP